MRRIIRNTHLMLGLVLVLFLLVYGVSSVQMAHAIRAVPQIIEEDLALAPGMEPRAVAQKLMDEHGMGGEMGKPSGNRFSIDRPGANFVVNYDPGTGRAHIRRQTRSVWGVLNRLHHLNGIHHESGALNAWGWALLIVSIGLLALGGTGVYLWYKMHEERVTGSILLVAHLAITVGLLVALRS